VTEPGRITGGTGVTEPLARRMTGRAEPARITGGTGVTEPLARRMTGRAEPARIYLRPPSMVPSKNLR